MSCQMNAKWLVFPCKDCGAAAGEPCLTEWGEVIKNATHGFRFPVKIIDATDRAQMAKHGYAEQIR
jgi:hypothetical protein